jgi:2',3'-cyclic-nucleotide 2'-phosphodiesterase (5'-nucleotidase family)
MGLLVGRSGASLLRYLCCALLGAALVVPRAATAATTTHITLVHMADVFELEPADQKGGLAEAAGLIRALRAKQINTVVTYGGDLISPSFMSSLTQGRQMVELMNDIGVAYAALGNHDFDFGPDVLRDRIKESGFRWLATSVREDDGSPFGGAAATAILRVGPVTLGFFSVLTPDTASLSSPGPHVHFLMPEAIAADAVKALRAAHVDVVIALTHETDAEDESLLKAVPGIDVALGGFESAPVSTDVQGVPLIKPGLNAAEVGVVDLTIDKDGGQAKVTVDARLEPTADIRPSAKIGGRIKAYLDDFDKVLAEPVATLQGELDSRAPGVRTGESSMGDLIAEAMRQAGKADIAIINGGGIRGDRLYAAGSTLTRKDIRRELPFENFLVVLEVSGADLLAALENGVSQVAAQAGRFPQVSGITFEFDPGKPVGRRVSKVMVDGAPLDPKKTYRLATNDYMARGGDGYDMLKQSKAASDSDEGRPLTQVVIDYLGGLGNLSLRPDGRIRQVE